MATYTPGANTYLPEFEPFVPDYKFLSTVLDVRQSRYDKNHQQMNDLYGKVVYADLSRKDTKEQRDQYIKRLVPSIEQVSRMDLSIQQNVDSARSLFKPFFEDDLIVKDIVSTSEYKRNAQRATTYMNSDKPEVREKYWDVGMKDLQYQMQDFIDASPEDALKMANPTYVDGVNLYRMSLDELTKQGFNIKEDIVTGDWIITQENGSLVTGTALQHVRKVMTQDPRVVNAYKAGSRVDQRMFVDEALSSGQYATKEQAQEAWANQTIKAIQDEVLANLPETQKELYLKETMVNGWNKYADEGRVIPGSDEERNMITALNDYEAAHGKLQQSNEILKQSEDPSSNVTGLLNKAYALQMSYNMDKDLIAAARSYSNKNASISYKENPYGVERVKQANRKELMLLEQEHDYKLANYEYGLQNQNAGITDGLYGIEPGNQDDITQNPALAITINQEALQDYNQTVLDKQLDFYLHAAAETSAINNPDEFNMVTYTINGEIRKNTVDKARKELLAGSVEDRKKFKADGKKLVEDLKKNPGFIKNIDKINELDNLEYELEGDILRYTQIKKELGQNIKDNFDLLLNTSYGKEVKEELKSGIPKIVDDSGRLLSREEYARQDYFKTRPNRVIPFGSRAGTVDIPISSSDDHYNKQLALISRAQNKDIEGFRPYSVDARLRGASTEDMDGTNLIINPQYRTAINPSNPDPWEATIATDYFNQMGRTPDQQLTYIVKGDDQAKAKRIVDQFNRDYAINNKNRSKPTVAGPFGELVYHPIYSEDSKVSNQAGYTISLSETYLAKLKSAGIISDNDILSNTYGEITILFPKDADISPRRSGEFNTSTTAAKIQFSDNDRADFDFGKSGNFSIYYKNNIPYIRGIQYTPDENTGNAKQLETIDMAIENENGPIPEHLLDWYVVYYKTLFTQNREAYELKHKSIAERINKQ